MEAGLKWLHLPQSGAKLLQDIVGDKMQEPKESLQLGLPAETLVGLRCFRPR